MILEKTGEIISYYENGDEAAGDGADFLEVDRKTE